MALWAKLLFPVEMAQPNVHTHALFVCVIKYSLKSLEKFWDQRKADLDLCKEFLASVSSALRLLYWTFLAWSTSLTMRCAFWWLARRMKGLIRSIQGTAIRANMTKKLCTSFWETKNKSRKLSPTMFMIRNLSLYNGNFFSTTNTTPCCICCIWLCILCFWEH